MVRNHPTFSERLVAVAGFPDAAPPVESEPAIGLLSDHQTVEAKPTEVLTHAIRGLSRGGDGPEWADGRTDAGYDV
jgi:hypothetical protein